MKQHEDFTGSSESAGFSAGGFKASDEPTGFKQAAQEKAGADDESAIKRAANKLGDMVVRTKSLLSLDLIEGFRAVQSSSEANA